MTCEQRAPGQEGAEGGREQQGRRVTLDTGQGFDAGYWAIPSVFSHEDKRKSRQAEWPSGRGPRGWVLHGEGLTSALPWARPQKQSPAPRSLQ